MKLLAPRLAALAVATVLLASAMAGAATAAEPPAAPVGGTVAEPRDAQPCVASALSLREVGVTDDGSSFSAVYALKNDGSAACRIVGGVSIRLYDTRGQDIPVHFAPRTTMAMLLTLEPGAEASFTVSLPSTVSKYCRQSARIEASVAQLPALSAKSSLMACIGPLVHVSNLRLGLPPTSSRDFG
jgi:hypothetical protein